MDFVNRIIPNQPQVPRSPSPPDSVELPKHPGKAGHWHETKRDVLATGSHVGTGILLFIVALLIAAVAWLIYSAAPASQGKYLDHSKLQAVFLNTGQVYFGNIQSISDDHMVLTNVFYLQSSNSAGSSSAQSNQNVSLIKLGCELHMPYDRMIINDKEVTFWENLQDNGKVAKAVAQFDKTNPNGQQCSDQAQAPASSSTLQNQSSANTPTNSTTNTNSSNATRVKR